MYEGRPGYSYLKKARKGSSAIAGLPYSALSKVFETIILQRLSPLLEEQGFPNQLQTAYQKGISSTDATFATQEILTNHRQDGGQPYLCLFDIEKAFDSVEFTILLQRLNVCIILVSMESFGD